MKKVSSNSKVTTKAHATLATTQTINMNSPKATYSHQAFKSDHKKAPHKHRNQPNQNDFQLPHKKCKKITKPICKSEKQLKTKKQEQLALRVNCQSERQLKILSEKIKRLEIKIKDLKAKKTQKQYRLTAESKRNISKDKIKPSQNSSHRKKSHSANKNWKNSKKNITTNTFKKSLKDKKLRIINRKEFEVKRQKKNVHTNQQDNSQLSEKQHDLDVLHRFITQVPEHELHYRISQRPSISNTSSILSQSEIQSSLYYLQKLILSLGKPNFEQFKQHSNQSLQTIHFLSQIDKPTYQQLEGKMVNLKPTGHKYTIVLDLDETLIHCNDSLNDPYDIKVRIKFPTGENIDAGINIRPYAQQFLSELSQICEVIVFTASHQCYANVVLDYLDPKKEMISHRIFRQSCWQTQQGIYVKDLRVLNNRNLDQMLLVDNAAYSYIYQLQNGIPIIPYYNNESDIELQQLLTYIQNLISQINSEKQSTNQEVSLQKLNDNYFKLNQYLKYDEIEQLIREVYKKSPQTTHHDHFDTQNII